METPKSEKKRTFSAQRTVKHKLSEVASVICDFTYRKDVGCCMVGGSEGSEVLVHPTEHYQRGHYSIS